MGDLESTLKTQAMIAESYRQNAADLSSRISAGFQAASEGVKFEGEVSRSMVQSAAQFKQIQIDEWYKKEALKNEAASLKIREQELILNNDYRKDQLAERSDYNQARMDTLAADREYKLANDRNKKDAGLALSRSLPLKSEIEIYEEKNRQLEEDKKRIIDLHNNNPAKVSLASKNSQVKRIEELQANNIKSINANRSKIGKYLELEQRFLSGTIDRNVGYEILGIPIEDLPTEPGTYENIDANGPNPLIDNVDTSGSFEPLSVDKDPFDRVTGKYLSPKEIEIANKNGGTLVTKAQQPAQSAQQPAQKASQQQPQSNYKPNVNISILGDKQRSDFRFYDNTEDQEQDEFSELDLENYANNTNSNFNPETFKQIYQKLPEDKRIVFERDLSLKRASDAAKKAHASVNKLDYESSINPRYSAIVPYDDYEKQADVLEEAKRLHVAANGGDPKSVITSEIPLQRFKDAAVTIFGLNKNVTPEKTKTDELIAKGGSLIGDNKNPTPTKGESVNKYYKIMGVDTDEALISGDNEQRRDEAKFLQRYEELFATYKDSKTEMLMDEIVANVPPSELNFNWSNASEDPSKDLRIAAGKIIGSSREKAIKLLVDAKIRKEYPRAYSMPSSTSRARAAMSFSPLAN